MKIKIASINFWGLPWPLSVDKSKRIRRLADFIKNKNPDIVALQEMWLARDIEFVLSELKDYHHFSPPSSFFNSSGLLLLSKSQLEDCYSAHFDKIYGDYEFARKGFLSAACKIGSRKIRIVNTHLYCPGKPENECIRDKQLNFLKSHLNDLETLVFGDFNTDWRFIKMPEKFKMISSKNPTVDSGNPYTRRGLNMFNEPKSVTFDMIFSNFQARIVRREVVTMPLMSDHYPVFSEIMI